MVENTTEWRFAKYPLHFNCYQGLDYVSANYENVVYTNFGNRSEHKAAPMPAYKFRAADLAKVEHNAITQLKTDTEKIATELSRAESLYSWEGISLQQAALNFGEEAGEVLRAVNNFTEGKGTLYEIEQEAVQAGAMALRLLKLVERLRKENR